MKESNDALYLQHIRDAIAQTEDYLVDVDEPTFLESKLLQDGFFRHLQSIGEAARRLSPELHALLPGGCLAGHHRHASQARPRLLWHRLRGGLDNCR